ERSVQSKRILVLLMLLIAACAAPAKAPPSYPPLHFSPATDLVQAASIHLLVDVRPREILSHADLAHSFAKIIPDENFRHFSDQHANIDLRELAELTYAQYPDADLVLARGIFDPASVERIFDKRAMVDGRAIDRKADALGTIVRTWGSIDDDRIQIALFGPEMIGVEKGRFGPLRVAEFFAQEKLKRASPALRAEPFESAAAFLGDAPFRAFAAGPFEGTWKKALGGLLGASTAIAISIKPAQSDLAHDGDTFAITLALFGSWGDDSAAAGARLAAVVDFVRASTLGALCGLDTAVVGPTKRISKSVIAVDATFRTEPFFQGIRDATSSNLFEIFRNALE
ncbi:MAG: hypothetical protein ABI183_27465, partial [Polyangiaceae bacterium]